MPDPMDKQDDEPIQEYILRIRELYNQMTDEERATRAAELIESHNDNMDILQMALLMTANQHVVTRAVEAPLIWGMTDETVMAFLDVILTTEGEDVITAVAKAAEENGEPVERGLFMAGSMYGLAVGSEVGHGLERLEQQNPEYKAMVDALKAAL